MSEAKVPTRASIRAAIAEEQAQIDKGPPDSCKVNQVGYVEWHAFAERERAAGRKQRHCATCDRWKFPSERCNLYRRRRPAQ